MPELPEVETTRRGIAPYLEGQRVERVIVRERRLRWPIPEDLDVRLSGQRIVSVERRAKYLLLGAEAGTLISHLGMSGSLRLVESGTPASRHEHVDIELASGMALRYTDPRRFGAMLWSLAPLEHELLRNLGPEPLTDAFAGQRLFALSRGRQHLRQRSAVRRRHRSAQARREHLQGALPAPGGGDQADPGDRHRARRHHPARFRRRRRPARLLPAGIVRLWPWRGVLQGLRQHPARDPPRPARQRVLPALPTLKRRAAHTLPPQEGPPRCAACHKKGARCPAITCLATPWSSRSAMPC